MPFRLSTLASLLALSLTSQAALACTGHVTLDGIDTGVPNVAGAAGCLDSVILDEANLWGSHPAFVNHVRTVSQPYVVAGQLDAAQRARLQAAAAQSDIGKTLQVKIISFNDFHGNLESPGSFSGVPAGGVDVLAAYVNLLKGQNPNNVVVSAGDLVGASPLISALFHDEPTIETMNRLGLEFNAVGNHEFDDGREELLRMQNGGCHPTDPNTCQGAQVGTPVPFEGAKFNFLAANVVDTATGETLFPAYMVKNFKGNRVAFIGMTLEGTPSIVSPSGVAGLAFHDEADTVNALIPELKRRGIESIVVLIHEGGLTTGGINECPNASGAILDIVKRFSDAVDLVVSGHTHRAYICALPNAAGRLIPVTSGGSFGRVITDTTLTLDTRSREVIAAQAQNLVVDRTQQTPVAEIANIVAGYKALAAPIANQVIGSVTVDVTRTVNAAGESALGDVIADAQFAATAAPEFGNAVVGFMNPGGIRADLLFTQSGTEGDGNVTYGEAFTVQPFGNSLVTMTLSGAQIETLLEQQFTGCPNNQPFNRILQVSEGFSYTWDNARPACDKIDPATIKIAGVVLDPAASYRLTVNSFLADGGDNFTVLTQGTDRLGGAQDLDALSAYFAAKSPVAPGAQNRILRLN
jgi:5'-nucleotidase